jgi:crotonobetainyl-CoA:carnitine CoA-transferase CaiB-like acyl-CoA transferase
MIAGDQDVSALAESGPLADLRVIDIGHVLAGPFAGTLLGDFGAEVIKVEDPRSGGDTVRALSPRYRGAPVWWKVAGRNKKSLGLDLRDERGKEILLGLVKRSDVLIENFRPGTIERWGIGPDSLHAANPRLVIVRISGSGRGPRGKNRPGYGRVGEAMSGVAHLTGEPAGRPLHVGFSLGDATTGLMAAFGALVALHARQTDGRGEIVDLALFETLFRMIEWQIPFADLLNTVIGRQGNRFPIGYAVAGSFRTRDSRWITISAATPSSIRCVLRTVGGRDMEQDPRFSDFDARAKENHLELIEKAIATWVSARDADAVAEAFRGTDVAVGPVYDAAMMLQDEIFEERAAIVGIDDPEVGRIRMPGIVPKLARQPGKVRWAGPSIGEHTDEILGALLDLSPGEIQALRNENVVR